MALNIQQPNLSGLASLAGRGQGNLNLGNAGALGLQALQQAQQQENARRQQALELIRTQQQGQLGLLSNQTQNRAMDLQALQQQRQGLLQKSELGLKQQQMGMQGSQFQDEMALKQAQMGQQGELGRGQLALQQQQQAQEAMKLEMAKLMDEDKKVTQEKGAFANYAIMAMQDAKSPEEANMIRQEILKDAAKNKYLSKEEVDAAKKMPISMFNNSLKFKSMQYGAVNDLKGMMAATGEKADKSGKIVIERADGTKVVMEDPTAPVETQLQKDVLDREQALQELSPIRKNYNENYLTYAGQAGLSAAKVAEKTKGIPVADTLAKMVAGTLTGKDEQEQAQYIQDATKYLTSVERFFQQRYRKPITGAQAAVNELKELRKNFLSGDMSPSEFQGALDGIVQNYTSESEFKKNVLREGLDVSPAKTYKYNPETGRLE